MDWEYIESLKQSDHRDIPDLEIKNGYIEFKKKIYGSEHRIIVYKGYSLFKKQIMH
ncbi:MAG: hypothetical protein ACP5TO_06040 [Thermoplasmata archaeon]